MLNKSLIPNYIFSIQTGNVFALIINFKELK